MYRIDSAEPLLLRAGHAVARAEQHAALAAAPERAGEQQQRAWAAGMRNALVRFPRAPHRSLSSSSVSVLLTGADQDIAAEAVACAAEAAGDVSSHHAALARLERGFADDTQQRRAAGPVAGLRDSEDDDADMLDELDAEDQAAAEGVEEDELLEDDDDDDDGAPARPAVNVPAAAAAAAHARAKPGGRRRKRVVLSDVAVPQVRVPKSSPLLTANPPPSFKKKPPPEKKDSQASTDKLLASLRTLNPLFVAHRAKCDRCAAAGKQCVGMAERACYICKAAKIRCSMARKTGRPHSGGGGSGGSGGEPAAPPPPPPPHDVGTPAPPTHQTLMAKPEPEPAHGASSQTPSRGGGSPPHPPFPPAERGKRPRDASAPPPPAPAHEHEHEPPAQDPYASAVSRKRARIDHELGLRAAPAAHPRSASASAAAPEAEAAASVLPPRIREKGKARGKEREREKEKERGERKAGQEQEQGAPPAGRVRAGSPCRTCVARRELARPVVAEPAPAAFGSIADTAAALAGAAAGITAGADSGAPPAATEAAAARLDDGALLRLVTPLLQMQAAMSALSAELVRAIEQNANARPAGAGAGAGAD
ncbi:hypothetical protein DFH11DRAFT_1876554, partial [Phellopilus nigrolimitatus]